MSRYFKFSLQERMPVGIDMCRTIYETNISISENPNLEMLKKSLRDSIYTNLGIREPVESVHMEFAVNLKSSLGVQYTKESYSLVIHESGKITRVPETFVVEMRE